MIRHIEARSVNEALNQGLLHIRYQSVEEPSRNGAVFVSPMPVITTYTHPRNRVLVNARRDANPFFHLFESLWMLAGNNDLAFPQKFVSTFDKYSDDGVTLHGAYGYRWRRFFGFDQLEGIIEELRGDPSSRRCVLTMWSAERDVPMVAAGGKDVPCNTQIYFDTIGGKLNMTVLCRSNDVIWGAHGANAVHFSFLLEYMALMTELPMGVYRQFSNNYHIYENLMGYADLMPLAESVARSDIYMPNGRPVGVESPMLFAYERRHHWHEDLLNFTSALGEVPIAKYQTPFFTNVIAPMYQAWSAWKAKDFAAAKRAAQHIGADDWQAGALSWLEVRELNRKQKEKK